MEPAAKKARKDSSEKARRPELLGLNLLGELWGGPF